jgi:Uma2 family endonuclease
MRDERVMLSCGGRAAPAQHRPLPLKLRVEDLALEEAGAFEDYSKTELIEGQTLNSQHRPHARMKLALYDCLRDRLRAIGSTLRPLVEASIAMPLHSVPEPDIVLAKEPDGDGLIPLSSVVRIVEVSDTSIRTDLGRKAALYDGKGVPEYWVAGVDGRVIRQLWSQQGGGYAEQQQVAFGGLLAARTIHDLRIETATF